MSSHATTSGSQRVSALPTARLRLPEGWTAQVMLRDAQGNVIDAHAWRVGLAGASDLFARADRVLKQDGDRWVIAVDLALAERRLQVVAKHHVYPGDLAGIVRSLLPGRAMRNFQTACTLIRAGVPVTWPLAALERAGPHGQRESLFITERIAGAVDLHAWVQQWTAGQRDVTPAARRTLARRLGETFARLDRAGLWHRDAKAGNFLVAEGTDGPAVYLVDLDGVRSRPPWATHATHRGPAKLAATLIWAGSITTTDAWRAVHASARAGNRNVDKAMVRSLYHHAVAERLATFIMAARAATGDKERP